MSNGNKRSAWSAVSLSSLLLGCVLAGCASSAHSQGGGYYLDDGPGRPDPRRVARLMAMPDPVPVDEPLVARANRPYRVMGKEYVPMTERRPYRRQGIASWYGQRFHGKATSTGERYDMYQMTAAHPTLPLPSYVRVTRLDNGRSTVVRVNDRGPFLRNRLIDLSYLAASKLGYVGQGYARVEVELLDPASGLGMSTLARTASAGTVAAGAIEARARSLPDGSLAATRLAWPVEGVGAVTPQTPAALARVANEGEEPAHAPGPSDAGQRQGWWLQLGVFRQLDNALRVQREQMARQTPADLPVELEQIHGQYRVMLGPYDSRAAARRVAADIAARTGERPALVQP